MKHLKLCLTLLLAVLMLVGCSSPAPAPSAQEPENISAEEAEQPAEEPAESEEPTGEAAGVTVTDMTGRQIDLEGPANRIVALSPSDCEILYELGAGDCLVGRGEYCDYPAEVLEVPSVQSGAETNLEQILSLEPQVLIMTKMGQTVEQVEALEKAGIRVVVSDAQDIAGTYDAISLLGALTGKESEAAALNEEMQGTFANLQENAVVNGEKTVYFEVSPLEYGLWAAGSNTFMNEVAQMLNLKNVFEDVDGWGEVSEEQVLSRNPDCIVTVSMYFGEGPTPVEEILSRPGWDSVTAVQNNAILNLANNELSRPGPRLAEGAQRMYDFIYGEAA